MFAVQGVVKQRGHVVRLTTQYGAAEKGSAGPYFGAMTTTLAPEDRAGCVVIAPPAVPGGKFRILERHQWRGMDFRAQAESIKKLTQQYNLTYIGIDSTVVGLGVYENVKMFFPAVKEFVYNPNVKNALVLKAYDIISGGRLEFDASHHGQRQSTHLRSQPQRRSEPRRSGEGDDACAGKRTATRRSCPHRQHYGDFLK